MAARGTEAWRLVMRADAWRRERACEYEFRRADREERGCVAVQRVASAESADNDEQWRPRRGWPQEPRQGPHGSPVRRARAFVRRM